MSTSLTPEQRSLEDWPREPTSGRYLCTLSQPMPSWARGTDYWVHQDYTDHGDGMCAEGCCDVYECRACGTVFTVEGAD